MSLTSDIYLLWLHVDLLEGLLTPMPTDDTIIRLSGVAVMHETNRMMNRNIYTVLLNW